MKVPMLPKNQWKRMTEMDASLYGAVLEDRIALHDSDVVMVDDGPGRFAQRYAVYYRGEEHLFDDAASSQEAAEQFKANRVPDWHRVP